MHYNALETSFSRSHAPAWDGVALAAQRWVASKIGRSTRCPTESAPKEFLFLGGTFTSQHRWSGAIRIPTLERGNEIKKFGKALLEINALKTENGQLKEKLENAKAAIRALETERDRQFDFTLMERSHFLEQIKQMSKHIDNISRELDRYKKESE